MAGYRQRQELIFYTQPHIAVRRETVRRGKSSTTHMIKIKTKPTTAMGECEFARYRS
jgi:hypothetical protein